jgi:hypothetical protein
MGSKINRINIGDMVAINAGWKKKGQRQAITAWESKTFGLNFFHSQQPQSSEEYPEWFKTLAESAGWVKQIDGEWAQVVWSHLESPLWLSLKYLKRL